MPDKEEKRNHKHRVKSIRPRVKPPYKGDIVHLEAKTKSRIPSEQMIRKLERLTSGRNIVDNKNTYVTRLINYIEENLEVRDDKKINDLLNRSKQMIKK